MCLLAVGTIGPAPMRVLLQVAWGSVRRLDSAVVMGSQGEGSRVTLVSTPLSLRNASPLGSWMAQAQAQE